MTEARKVRGAGPRRAAPTRPTRRAAKAVVATAGAGDARVLARTGRGLDDWFRVLDGFGAAQKGHTASARHLVDDHGVDGWYAQSITVAYERARGLRSANQRLSGFYEVSVSKVVDAPLARVAGALARPAERGCEAAIPRSGEAWGTRCRAREHER